MNSSILRGGFRSLFPPRSEAELRAMKAGRKLAQRRFLPHLLYAVPAAVLSMTALVSQTAHLETIQPVAMGLVIIALFILFGMTVYWAQTALRAWDPVGVELTGRHAALTIYADDPADRTDRALVRFFEEAGAEFPIRVRVHYPHGVRIAVRRCSDMRSLRERVASIIATS